ncbi:hypothetical protein BASA81_002989 [Batrachochytrium salamandrivorans]|nr:hypothetical protein BASA81_002989 [Batrachochytrium salamandrivorans]
MSSTPTPSSMVTRGAASAAKQGSKQASEQAPEQDSEQAPKRTKHIKVAAAAAIEQPKKRRLPKSATPAAASGEGLDATPKPKLPTKGKRVQLSVFAQLQTPLLFVAPPALVAVKTAPNSTKLREDARGKCHNMEQPNPSHSPVEEEELRCMKELEEESAARLKKYAEDQKRSDLRNIELMDQMKKTRARIAEAKVAVDQIRAILAQGE